MEMALEIGGNRGADLLFHDAKRGGAPISFLHSRQIVTRQVGKMNIRGGGDSAPGKPPLGGILTSLGYACKLSPLNQVQ